MTKLDLRTVRSGRSHKDNLVQYIDLWGPDFSIKFDMRVVTLPNIAKGWYNIMSFTKGGDGTAIPDVYLHTITNGGNPYLHIAISKKR